MKKIILLLIIAILALNCKEKPNKQETQTIGIDQIDTIDYKKTSKIIKTLHGNYGRSRLSGSDLCDEFYEVLSNGKKIIVSKSDYYEFEKDKKIIETSDFTPMPYAQFKSRIMDLYHIDIDSMGYYYVLDGGYNLYHADDETKIYMSVIVFDGYIANTFGTFGWDEDDYDKYAELLILRNKMILYDDTIAFNKLKFLCPQIIISQVRDYGVVSNKKWLDYTIAKTDFYEFSGDETTLENFLVGLKNRFKETDKNWYFRKDMLDTLINRNVSMAFLGSVMESFEWRQQKNGFEDKQTEDAISYIWTKIAELEQYGYIEDRIDRNPKLIEKFRKNNYWNSEQLRNYCEKMYKTKQERNKIAEQEEAANECVIDDKDGYTNMRSGKGVTFDVITTIPDKADIYVLDRTDENWWKVSYEDYAGYVHKSRIKSRR